MGVPPNHFTHIFIDEAGHAEEPLTLSAIAGFMTPPPPNGLSRPPLLILAGEPNTPALGSLIGEDSQEQMNKDNQNAFVSQGNFFFRVCMQVIPSS
jgi:hypothetical protein